MAQLYRNKSDQEQTVVGIGVWKPGETRSSLVDFINPNFEKVDSASQAPATPVTPATPTTEEKGAQK